MWICRFAKCLIAVCLHEFTVAQFWDVFILYLYWLLQVCVRQKVFDVLYYFIHHEEEEVQHKALTALGQSAYFSISKPGDSATSGEKYKASAS